MKCEICNTNKGSAHICNGDGRRHRHGAVHTYLRGNTNDLAWLCGSCHDKDRQAWKDFRSK